MRGFASILGICLLASVAWGADQPPAGVAILPCGQGAGGGVNCAPSKQDLKQAKSAYERGLKLARQHQGEQALSEFETAARLSPKNVNYLTARELQRQDLVSQHLEQGNNALLRGKQIEAMADFRAALGLDPSNTFALQRLDEALQEWAPKAPNRPVVVPSGGEIEVFPESTRADFHYQGDSKALLTQIATVFGLTANIDDGVTARPVRFDITNVDFYEAMRAAGVLTKTFWSPMSEKQILIAPDTAEAHRQFERLALRTFWIPWATTPTELTEVVNTLRSVFDMKFINQHPQSNTITVRAPVASIEAATQFIETMGDARPQVLLDVNIYEVSHTVMHNYGIHLPSQFTLYNIPAAALGALGGQNIQQLINQLIAGGGINQAGNSSLSSLLAMLQGGQNSIFSNPLATFGGGLTLFGLTLDSLEAQLGLNESSIRHLEHATLRVSQGNEASYKVGTRYPILNASFAPIYNTPAIAQTIQSNTFATPFPSFNYEDIGLTLKAKPAINPNNEVSLQLEMQIRSLGAQSLNGVPVISNREYKGGITLRNGEPSVIAGMVSRTETRSLQGIPGLGAVPGVNQVMSTNAIENDDDELLVVIVPHVIANVSRGEEALIYMGR